MGITKYLIAAACVVSLICGYKFGMWRYDRLQASFSQYQAEVKQAAAQAEKDAKTATDKAEKIRKTQNAEYEKKLADLGDDIVRLRRAASRSYLPTATKSAGSAKRICFDRSKLDEAIKRYGSSVQGIAAEGDHHRIGLDAAKRWSQELNKGE